MGEWIAGALMICLCGLDVGASFLGVSGRVLSPCVRGIGVTWHEMCDRVVADVCRHHLREDGTKESTVAAELGFDSTKALVRAAAVAREFARKGNPWPRMFTIWLDSYTRGPDFD